MTEITALQIQTTEGPIIIHKPTCYNCGKPIIIENGFMMDFEPYQSNYPNSPDIPESYYLICGDCSPEWMKMTVKL